jgi:two-component system LytT family response regulator
MRVLIVDDETIARVRLRRLLSSHEDVVILGEAADGRAALDMIVETRPDLVFLDINMTGLDGFEVVKLLPEDGLPMIVFVTAYDEHALRAFRVAAMDYLLKPFDGERLAVTLNRARTHASAAGERREMLRLLAEMVESQHRVEAAVARQTSARPGEGARQYPARIPVRSTGRIRFVAVRDIDYIESAANYVKLHVGNDCHVVRQKIGELAAVLDPSTFARIHRRTIVNLSKVREVQPWFSGDAVVILDSGERLRLSRGYREAIQPVLLDRSSGTG